MSYGFFCQSDSGSTLIDGSSKNFKIIASGVATGGIITFPTQPSIPLIFARPPSYGQTVTCPFEISASSVKFPVGYKYIIMIPFDTPTAGDWGLQVRNESGELVFDTNNKIVTIDSITKMETTIPFQSLAPWSFQGQSGPGIQQNVSTSLIAGRERYILVNNLWIIGSMYSFHDDWSGSDYFQTMKLKVRLNSETSFTIQCDEAFEMNNWSRQTMYGVTDIFIVSGYANL